MSLKGAKRKEDWKKEKKKGRKFGGQDPQKVSQ